jgi:hypothetical protein
VTDLNLLLDDHRPFHSEFQLENFIVSKSGHGNLFGQYKQVLRELDSRKRTLRDYDLQLRRFKAQHKVASDRFFRIEVGITSGERELMGLEIEELENAISDLEATISDIRREQAFLLTLGMRLKGSIGDLDDDSRRELEREHRLHVLKFQIATEIVCHNAISPGIIETVCCLSPEDRAEVLTHLNAMVGSDQECRIRYLVGSDQ